MCSRFAINRLRRLSCFNAEPNCFAAGPAAGRSAWSGVNGRPAALRAIGGTMSFHVTQGQMSNVPHEPGQFLHSCLSPYIRDPGNTFSSFPRPPHLVGAELFSLFPGLMMTTTAIPGFRFSWEFEPRARPGLPRFSCLPLRRCRRGRQVKRYLCAVAGRNRMRYNGTVVNPACIEDRGGDVSSRLVAE